MKSVINHLIIIFILTGCGSDGSSGSNVPGPVIPVVNPSLIEITVTGIPVELGNFDPAPTVDAGGGALDELFARLA